MKSLRTGLCCGLAAALGLGSVLAPPRNAQASGAMWRALITLPDSPATIDPLDAWSLADQLGDSLATEAALARPDWPAHLRDWCEARTRVRYGDPASASELFARAAAHWPAGAGEPDLVLALFDRQRLALPLSTADLGAARKVLQSPLRPHHDPVWRALRGRVLLLGGESPAAAAEFDRAWSSAGAVERRHPVFLYRGPAHLAAGDSTAAVLAWQESVSGLRRAEHLREASAVWDANPGLREALRHSADPWPTLRFLVRIFRREDAADLARDRLAHGAEDRGKLEMFVAEQLYRLRAHEALSRWISELDTLERAPEDRARLEGYRWGMARREGVSLEVAEGFDALAERWAGTARAAEAWWESAWMYELLGDPDNAVQRYARHVRLTDSGRFRSSAALRTIFLPARDGDLDAAMNAYREFGDALGSGMDQAAAWFTLGTRGEDGERWLERLREEHPASPFWRGARPDEEAGIPRVGELFAAQRNAFEIVGKSLGIGDPLQDLPEALEVISRLARLGLRSDATVRLDQWAREHSSDNAARLRAVAVAWRGGLPEMQGRHGWFLDRRLSGEDPDLDAAIRRIVLPLPFAGTVLSLARDLQIPPEVIWALMKRESFFDADVLSLAGAYGLLQLLPTTASRVARDSGMADPSPSLLYVPAVNLRLGTAYLAGLLEEAQGNWIRALASYNAGEANGKRWEERVREGETPATGILLISYTETRSYVYNVLRTAHSYRDSWRDSWRTDSPD